MSARRELREYADRYGYTEHVNALLDAFRAEVIREAAKLLADRGYAIPADIILTSPAAVPVPDETAGDETGEAPHRCTCARSWGLHSKDCALYTPGHEQIATTSPCQVNVTGHRMVNGHCLYCAKSEAEVQS